MSIGYLSTSKSRKERGGLDLRRMKGYDRVVSKRKLVRSKVEMTLSAFLVYERYTIDNINWGRREQDVKLESTYNTMACDLFLCYCYAASYVRWKVCRSMPGGESRRGLGNGGVRYTR